MGSVYASDSNRCSHRASSGLWAWLTRWGWKDARWLLVVLVITGTAGSFWNLQQREEQLSQDFPLQGTELQMATLQEMRQLYAHEVVGRLLPYGIEAVHDY